MKRLASLGLAAAAVAALAVAGCEKQIEAPRDIGVCWHMGFPKGKPPQFNKVAENQPSLEYCAAQLEALRVRFLRLGGGNETLIGAYQGNFLFLEREGIFTSPTMKGGRYLALVRTGDGRLAMPGAVQQQ